MQDSLKIIGAHGKRRKNDFYPTPPEVTVALLDFLEKRFLIRSGDTFWEPACGDGQMVKVMEHNGYNVIGTDIVNGQDYLNTEISAKYEWIITNPPFVCAEDFIKRSIHNKKPFALLLKSQYWHSAKRLDLFMKYQPTYILPLTWRPDFTGMGASMLDMIWVVWIGKTNFTQYLPLGRPN